MCRRHAASNVSSNRASGCTPKFPYVNTTLDTP